MSATSTAPLPFPAAVVPTTRVGEILERATKGRAPAWAVLLLALDETVILRIDRTRPASPDQARCARAPVRVRGKEVATVELHGPAAELDGLKQSAEEVAHQIAETCSVAQEIDSLASEIIHSYEELHLLYELGEALTQQLSVAHAANLIIDRLWDAIPARRIELHLGGPNPLRFHRGDPERWGDAEEQLTTQLRSGGEPMGSVALARVADGPAFTSVEAKLLGGVGTIAASALHNARLYEQLCEQAAALSEREANLSAVMDNVAEGIITVDDQGTVASINPAAERMFGRASSEVVGRPLRILAPELDLPAVEDRPDQTEALEGAGSFADRMIRSSALSAQIETIGRRRDHSTFPIEITVSTMHANGQEMFIVSVRDVTERRRWEQVLEHQAHHDALTDLPNRNLFARELSGMVCGDREPFGRLALLLLDLDHFKEVNDTLGHQAGDRLLQQIGPRLRSVLRPDDLIARLGGDEFGLLLNDADPERARGVALDLLETLDRPFLIDGHSLCVSASIGIAIFPDHGQDVDSLLKHSDVAMYDAKRSQDGYRVYAPERDQHSPRRLEIKGELRLALERGEFVLHYQPQVELRSGRVTRAEALLRWRHPDRGIIMPAQFVPLAEQVGMIDALSNWVIDAALRQIREWLDRGSELCVAVNLSAQNLHDARLPEMVAQLLNERGVPPSLLKIEITEGSLMVDPVYAFKILSRLSAMGVRIGIDDFGTGYSSLAYLKRLPVDEIKIDKSFVLQMATNENDLAIVRSTIGLGHDLGLAVVAEGVENSHTRGLLSELGCDLAQGYFLGRPVPPGDLARIIAYLREGRPLPEALDPAASASALKSALGWVAIS